MTTDGDVEPGVVNGGESREGDSSKRMRLRYAGVCRRCGISLPAGESAIYFRVDRNVECLGCFASVDSAVVGDRAQPQVPDGTPDETAAIKHPAVDVGEAGASARREFDRRVAKREQRVRAAHPRLGGLILAVTDEPQSTKAWRRGAAGEERLGRHLDTYVSEGALVLHDRRIPRTTANIDHILIAPAGIFVIDAKRYAGRPHLRVEGGLLRPRTETLMVGSRNCSKLVAGVQKQVAVVRDALDKAGWAPIHVRGMLCFVDADWPMVGGSFAAGGVHVLWPKRIAKHAFAGEVIPPADRVRIHASIANAFPPA